MPSRARAVPDQITRYFSERAAAVGGGNAPAGRAIITATTFYLNALTGNDANTGLTPTTAWRTHEALRAALGIYGLISPGGPGGQRWFNVRYQGAIPTDLLNMQAVLDANACLNIIGTDVIQVLHTGTISAVTQFTNTSFGAITDAGVSSWTPYVDNRILWTSGAQAGSYAFVMHDTGGGSCRIGAPFLLFDVVATGRSFAQEVAATTGTYVVQKLASVFLGNFAIQSTPNGNQIEPFVNFTDITFDWHGPIGADPQPELTANCTIAFQGCVIKSQAVTIDLLFCGCHFPNGVAVENNFSDLICVSVKQFLFYGYASVGLLETIYCDGCGLMALNGSNVSLGNFASENAIIGIFNDGGDCITTTKPSYPPGTITYFGQGYCYGTGAVGYGWRSCVGTTTLAYYKLPNVTGALGDFIVADVRTASVPTAVPYIAATGSFGTTPVTCSWANMAVAEPTGFRSATNANRAAAHDPETRSAFVFANPGN